ncbi:MAG: fatty acid--CoA ligase [Gammaproteobacteria bacterium]|nr:fatty acid--CoA ligase [Gammaproteobacteria bacterium]
MSDSLFEPTPSAYAFPLLIRHLLRTPLAINPQREIVYGTRFRYTYEDFNKRICRLAGALSALEVVRGQTVAVMDWDSHRYLECFFAVPMLGAVLHTINVRLSPEQILYTINHAEDDVLLVHRDFLPMLAEIQAHIERPVRYVLLQDDAESGDVPGWVQGEYEALLEASRPDFEFGDFDENTRATTFYTTGTTGLPKAVYYSHRQILLHTLASMANTGVVSGHGQFHRDDVYMPITPMFHVHAWGQPFVATLMGVKQVYPGRYTPEGLLSLIRDEGVTFSHCVPTILHMLLSAPQAEDTDFSNWKVIVGGSALPRGLARRAMSLGIDIYSGYGMSETGPVLTTAHLDEAMLAGDAEEQLDVRIKSGRPLPLVDLRVVDESMHDVCGDGEVVVRAPWLTQGYFKEPERSAELWAGGYLHTGDIGHLDERGYLQVSDRLKDVIKSGGEWISSLQLEDLVSQLSGVSEVAAIGVADETWGERPMLLIVPQAEAQLDEAVVRAHLQKSADSGEINAWAVPERVLFVDSIEKTSVGKLDKKLLREKYA